MKSRVAKVLHPIAGRPMLGYVLDLIRSLKIDRTVAVLGHQHAEVGKLIPRTVKIAVQKKLLGTADALKAALPILKGFKGTVLVLYGDIPLLKKETIDNLINCHIKNNADATLLSTQLDKPQGYGRVLRDKYASISAIREEKDADDFEKEIKEINTGIICFKADKLAGVLRQVKANNRKKEYYLTDIISIFYKGGGIVESVKLSDAGEAQGINSRADLARANKIMHARINEEFMKGGVSIIDPASTFISFGVRIGVDSIIYPFTVIEKDVRIGKSCQIGPFIHLREGTVIEDKVLAGNFVEVVRSRISGGTWLKHFGYIGDSRIGRSVNIGAGTVTANFDGKKKRLTIIKDMASIGSDTILVAPVKIGKRATTGAGSVVTKNQNVGDRVTVVGVPAKPIK